MDRMRTRKLWAGGIALAVMFTTLFSTVAQAATSYPTVTSVSISLSINMEAGDDLPLLSCGFTGDSDTEVKIPNNSKYELQSAKWTTNTSSVKLGNTYTLDVYIGALDDYRFRGTYSSSNVKVKGGTFVSAQTLDNKVLLVKIRTKPVSGTLDSPEDAYWQESGGRVVLGRAKWSKVASAEAYDVYLYRSSKLVHKAEKVEATTYNFYPYMTTKGTYTFRVRAVPKSEAEDYAKTSEWTISDEVYVDEQHVSDGSGQKIPNGEGTSADSNYAGWLKNGDIWYYRYPDGSYQKNGWSMIGGYWYLFDANGAMLTGWQNRNESYYYLKPSGEMITGWYQDTAQNRWYYFNATEEEGTLGAGHKGWLQKDDKYYYMDEKGTMMEGWHEINGLVYYFYPGSGHMAKDTYIDSFYVDPEGVWYKEQHLVH